MMNDELGFRNGVISIGEQLSQILIVFVTNPCRKSLLFLRQILVTNLFFFCYKTLLSVTNIY